MGSIPQSSIEGLSSQGALLKITTGFQLLKVEQSNIVQAKHKKTCFWDFNNGCQKLSIWKYQVFSTPSVYYH